MAAPLPDTALFWASIATLWGGAAAWETFYAAMRRRRDDRFAAVRATLSGLAVELDVTRDWAGGAKDGRGYEQREPTDAEVKDWSNPTRQIFSFECPIIHNMTNSPYIGELQSIAGDIVKLSRSITRLFNCYGEYRAYVHSRPALYDSIVAKGSLPGSVTLLTPSERTYISGIFQFNRQIHQDLIGGADAPDPLCLHRAFRAAEASVSTFVNRLKKPRFPWWYSLLHVVAAVAIVKGFTLSLAWLGVHWRQ
jgi:hypothetical protein